ncbi:ABC transporter substrate-binding protein [Bosea sp. Tri-44]|uniref:ABC transporter substrate-binding protein n=1 Tax=Bosea sp. Tri-44 TaxID=1972137 RepID=UPI00100DC6DB|nr:ABC transporter substrate-binding protein [Bosea sp. Tri-44]RXT57421.1 ABC transporter substrate-binding protein [Bosea sp. Tri-44]
MPSIHRRDFLAASAALSGLAMSGLPAFAQTPRRGGTLRVSVDQAVAKLNPLVTRVNPEYLVAELLYSGLTRLKPDMSAEPDLAESWTNSVDLTEWTFSLRKGLSFHDGSPCTAADVVATFEAILDAKTASPARQNVGPVSKVAAKDDTTVVFTLSAPFADLPVTLAYTNAKIVPAAVTKGGLEKLDRQAIGTGPFKLVSFEPERLIVVARNDAFYDKARPYLDRIEVVVYPDVSAEASALISGDTDLITTTPPTEFARLQKASGVKALRVPSGQFCNVNFGCDQKPFNDIRVRQALALTVDRKTMVDFVTEGFGSVGNDAPLNPAYRFYAEQPLKQADIAKAKSLLAEAGYPKGLEATLIASDRPGLRTQLAVALREMAKPAGFDIKVETMPHATYLDQVWKKGSFYVGFYNMQATADAIFSLLYTSNAAWNETRWNNTAFDKLIFEARATVEEAKRRALYADAQKLMNAEVPSIIPAFFDLLGAQREWVQGYELHPRGAVFRLDQVSLGANAPKRG